MKASAGSLLRNTSGNATILFALAAVPLMIAAGVAIDRIRLDHARTEMQAALDGAALAAAMAEDRTDAQRERLARNYFKQNFSYAQANDVDFTIEVTASRVVAQSRIAHPTSFMRLAGIESTDLAVASEVMRPKSGKAEVVLVLDYSGSMSANKKSVRMAAAAAEMVRTLDEAMPDDKLKFGLVPFSAMVHTTMPADYVTQAAAGASWTGCTQDRVHPYNLTVDTPTGDAASKWGYIDKSGENNGAYGCAAYSARSLGILPLTTDMAAVKTKLGAMQPLGNTNIPLGAEFGWNLLDPAAPYEEGAPYSDTETKKYIVLLTDGVQTSSQFGPSGNRSVKNGNDNLTKLCNAINAKNITIFAIAYDITDPAVTKLLKGCAGSNYYEPDASGSEINRVFGSITNEIKNQHIRLAR